MFFETKTKFLFFFIKFILEKKGLTELPGHEGKLTSNIKVFRVQIEIFAAVFDWISKQQLNLLLFLSDWHCGKLGLTDLLGHDRKVTLDKKMIFISHQRHKGGYGDYCRHFSLIFEITSIFSIVFVRLILWKKGVNGVTWPRRKIDIRYQFHLKIILKDLDLGWK